jgi:hypothetical protein
VNEGVMSKKSKYNYLSTLKKLGLIRNFIEDQNIDFNVCYNFKEYYSIIENN